MSLEFGQPGHLRGSGHERDSRKSIADKVGRCSALIKGAVILPRAEPRDEWGTTITGICPAQSIGDGEVDKVLRGRLRHSR